MEIPREAPQQVVAPDLEQSSKGADSVAVVAEEVGLTVHLSNHKEVQADGMEARHHLAHLASKDLLATSMHPFLLSKRTCLSAVLVRSNSRTSVSRRLKDQCHHNRMQQESRHHHSSKHR